MKKILIGSAISLILSALLWLNGSAETFSVYVLCAFNVLSWIGALCGNVKGESSRLIRRLWPISSISSAIQIGSLVLTEHAILAASSFMVSVFIVSAAFSEKTEP